VVFEKITSSFKEFGLIAGLFYGVDRILARMGSGLGLFYYELMAQPVAEEPLLPPKLKKDLEIREIKRGDPVVNNMELSQTVLDFRFNQPTVCLGAFQNGKLIGSMWLCLGPYEEDEVRCIFVPLPETQGVFDFGLYVSPEHRLGLGFVGLWDGANAYLRGRGIHFSFSRVSRFNLTSRRVHEHLGWKRLGHALFLKLKWCQVMVATVSPYLHLSLSGSMKPTIRLQA
jgi:hypothetical protein